MDNLLIHENPECGYHQSYLCQPAYQGWSENSSDDYLSNQFHIAEVDYTAILREGAPIKQDYLKERFKATKLAFDRYHKINRDTLGRDDDLNHVSIHRNALKDAFKVLTWVEQQEALPDDIQDYIKTIKNELTNLIFASLPSVMEEILRQSKKIASDLEKPAPDLILDIDDTLIGQKQNCY